MKKICDLLLSNPLLLIPWGYEFPILTESELIFNVNTRFYKGRVKIQKEENGYSIVFEESNKHILFIDSDQLIEILKSELVFEPNIMLPFS